MKQYDTIPRQDWAQLCLRPAADSSALLPAIQGIYQDIQMRGDKAVLEYTAKFDGVAMKKPAITKAALRTQAAKTPRAVQQAIDEAYSTITKFHQEQIVYREKKMDTIPGVTCWQERRALDVAGLYVPGGSAPLVSTVLMLAIPAKLAGCKRIVLASPPGRDGAIPAPICYAALKTGVTEVFAVGGAQAIAAMAVGTETIPKVDKIVGPGNQYVSVAKQWAFMNGTAIDMIAGPSEVMVIADSTANPDYVAADLLSQAEHGPDSQVVLVTDDSGLARRVQRSLDEQLALLPRKQIAEQAMEQSFCLVVNDTIEALEFANQYAPEHLILAAASATRWAKRVRNAGSVFLGNYSPESAGDYASGTNHTLPTNGWARSTSGLSVESFTKLVSFQSLTKSGLRNLAPTIETLATTEGLEAHRRAVSIRLS